MAVQFSCGDEFLPSPLASKAEGALKAEPALVRKGQLSAVAVSVELDHTVAFVGSASGEVEAPSGAGNTEAALSLNVPAGPEGPPVPPAGGLRPGVRRAHRGEGQQEPAAGFQRTTSVHQRGETGQRRCKDFCPFVLTPPSLFSYLMNDFFCPT